VHAQAKELPWLPSLLFGGLSTAAGLLTLLLPETLGRPLPQTIDDIERWYSGGGQRLTVDDHADNSDPTDQLQMTTPINSDQQLNNDDDDHTAVA